MSQTKAQLISDLVQALNFTGTASAPANGLFLSATNTLQLSTASTPRLTINSDGHVDVVGNLDVGAGIDVTGASSFDGFITLSSTHNRIIFTDTNADPDYMVDSNGGHFLVYDATNNQDKIKIFSDGHTDIHGNVDFISGGIDVTGAITGTGDLTITGNASANAVQSSFGGITTRLGFVSGGAEGVVETTSNHSLVLGVNSSEKMRIDSSGRLLYGLTSSTRETSLILQGNSNSYTTNPGTLEVRIGQVPSAQTTLGQINFGCTGDKIGGTISAIADNADWSSGSSHPTAIRFFTTPVSSTTQAERMRIDSSGRVMINNTFGSSAHAAADDLIIGSTSGSNGMTILTSSATANIFFNDGSANNGSIQYIHSTSPQALRFNSAGQYEFDVAGTEVVRIDSSGNVGIGTTSPAQLLEIHGASNPAVLLKDTTNNVISYLYSQDLVGAVGTASNHPFVFNVNNGEKMRIDTSGNVGIGTTSPSTKLDVIGDMRTSTNIYVGESIFHDGDNDTRLRFDTPDRLKIETAGVERVAFGGVTTFNESGADCNFRIEGDTDENLFFLDAGNNRVGIGTNNPNGKFVVASETSRTDSVEHLLIMTHTSSGTTTTGFGTGIRFQGERNNGNLQTIGDIDFEADVNSGTNISAALVFKPSTSGSPTERMRIHSGGEVSIATTTTANARLFVNPNVDGTTQRGITISGRKDVYDVIPLNFVHATNNSSAGSVQFTSTAAVQYVTTSDYRLKQDVVTLTDSITKLKQLNPVHFKWKDMPSVETDGFLAHEVQTIVPSAIIGEKDAVDKDGNIEPQQIDTSKLVPLLVAALQEAIGKIETLETEVAALKAA